MVGMGHSHSYPPLFYPPSQLAWFREELINATTNCNAMVVVGHHAVYGVSGALRGVIWVTRVRAFACVPIKPPSPRPSQRTQGGQHAVALRQQDLKVRLNFPSVFGYLGVDAYFNGHGEEKVCECPSNPSPPSRPITPAPTTPTPSRPHP